MSTTQADREGLEESDENPSGMAFNETVPDLATMTLGALNVLSQNDEGFFLMSEGGAVDWIGHANELVPLWAFGPGSELFRDFVRTDQGAAELWSEAYGWDGAFVDNTDVFAAMYSAFLGLSATADEAAAAD